MVSTSSGTLQEPYANGQLNNGNPTLTSSSTNTTTTQTPAGFRALTTSTLSERLGHLSDGIAVGTSTDFIQPISTSTGTSTMSPATLERSTSTLPQAAKVDVGIDAKKVLMVDSTSQMEAGSIDSASMEPSLLHPSIGNILAPLRKLSLASPSKTLASEAVAPPSAVESICENKWKKTTWCDSRCTWNTRLLADDFNR
ncbi:hypothetical protein BC829DRAFT_45223 [Chytridium lagenaria]|nr:hypothetical protein BC829DRAFT_45223 [Chytridium lagenaria]